ncbi:hypothetical protein RV11_GL002557 [Enterococcus phoeniculicola]|jgi:hypothetical protein|uniref:Uncharacterized protein n=1 Tax=Enterococcus phoeniculicola ATCC BAA-412 TaxID=1158610 RepID=R3WFB8_9ENTE|nr:hypothetical protein [Enterococcus phoeniculicola]EOL46157.1 hypothetical protein UC3_00963 [Enterococcus phoeniculicola ATCC BAA-412]EOT76998.1 hypothetical protein I589_01959 [Enterococcus phoeniculicola ATCC BAA-412]OJG69566.1 hypothetical protein RV11_GL002557 [Enterococcus phoeniculicola]
MFGLVDFWGMTFGGTTQDTYEKSKSKKSPLPLIILLFSLIIGYLIFLYFL